MSEPDNEEPVGYKSPPVHSRFKPGASGNPSGRPKDRPRSSELMTTLLQEKRTVVIDGEQRRITLEEAVYRSMIAKASKGDNRALKMINDLLSQEERNRPSFDSKTVRLIMVRPEEKD